MPTRTVAHNTLHKGSWLTICDICGFRFHNVDLKKRWDGLMCCKDDWESRHPSDFQGQIDYSDNQNIPWARPDSNQNTSTTTVDGSSLDTDVQADTVGDEDKTLRVDGTPRMNATQEWNTTLTADRTVTLNTTSARNGDRFTIWRTAGGSFDLIIGSLQTTGIKSVTTIEFNGTAWVLISYVPTGL